MALCCSYGEDLKSKLLFVVLFVKSERVIALCHSFFKEGKSESLPVDLFEKSQRAKEQLPNPAIEASLC